MNRFRENLIAKVKEIKGNELPTMYPIYNKRGEQLGKINHNYEEKQNNYLKGVCVFLETENEKIIMEKRGNTKLNPKEEDYCSGHKEDDESYMQTVYREIREELGIKEEGVTHLTKILEAIPLNFAGRKFFIQFFYAKINSKDIKKQDSEVESYYEEEIATAFDKLRKEKTKFPYNGNEVVLEEIIQEVKKIREIQKEPIEKEEIK